MKRVMACLIVFSLLLCIFTSTSIVVEANSDDKYPIVEDSYKYFTDEEIQNIEITAKQLPEVYRYLILPSINSNTDIKEMAESLFNFRNFSQDTIFILVITDEKKIYITTGEALQKKDLNVEFFNNEIDKYFVPIVKEKKSIEQGLIELSKGISKDIPLYLETNKSSLKIPQPPEDNEFVDEPEPSSSKSIIIWIGIIAAFLLALWLILKMYFNKK